jgi:hypothetical protein
MNRSPMKRGTSSLKRSEIARTPIAAGTTSLKRTPMASRSKPMARSAIKPGSAQLVRSSPMAWKPIDSSASAMMSTRPGQRRMRTRGPKMTAIRRSAKGQECDLNITGICTYDTDTTVWCHSNLYADGKGMAIKANDEAGCNGCAACHAFYDGGWTSYPGWTRELVEERFAIARAKSRLKLKQKGLVE